MLLGAQGCQKCECKPCVPCAAECDPNTPAGFLVIYSGDFDEYIVSNVSANPVNVFPPLTGPFYAELGTIGSILLPSDDFPCYLRLKLWRNVFEKNGTPSEELLTESLTIKCWSGRVLVNGFLILNAGESAVWLKGTPEDYGEHTYRFDNLESVIEQVPGLDDQSGNPPEYPDLQVVALCAPASVSFSAKITWDSPDIHHVLYGQLLECYDQLPPEDPVDCLDCDGTPSPAPDQIYLTISNFDGGGAVDANNNTINYDGTYVMELKPTLLECAAYYALVDIPPIANVVPFSGGNPAIFASPSFGLVVTWLYGNNSAGGVLVLFVSLTVVAEDMIAMLCGGASLTGSYFGAWQLLSGGGTTPAVSFDWELST